MAKVLYLTANPNRASSNVPVEGWFELLGGKGLAPVLVSTKRGTFQEWAISRGVPTYETNLPVPNKWRPWEYMATLWRLRRIIRRHGIQLIHAIEQNVFPIAGDLARFCGLPVLVGIHCRIERSFGQWAFGGRRQPTRLFFLTKGSEKVCRAAVEGVVPESSWRLLYNGLDITRIRPDESLRHEFRAQHNLGSGQLIGAASWLRPGKQIEHLFEMVARQKQRDFTLVLAGGVAPGEEKYAESVLEQGKAQLGDRLRFLGCLSDMRGFYNALDLYVNTSKEETCSISVMESLACGCPIVGYPSVSVDEQVLPGGGEIVAQDDRAALAAAVDRWLSGPITLTSSRISARERAEEMFDIRKLSNQLWDEYRAVLEGTAA
jgi:glycosyltransferase involved in cell wall biosynthesis